MVCNVVFTFSESGLMAEIFSSDVRIPTYSGQIHGTLNHNNTNSNSVAILLLADAGKKNRDGNAGSYNNSSCLKFLSEELARFGIPTLRYDKRGVGMSKTALQCESELRFDDFIEDAVHAVQYMKNQLRYSRVIILGHGDGSLIGMLASKNVAVDGFVSIACRAENMAELFRDRLKHQLSPPLLSQAEVIISQLVEGCVTDDLPVAFEDIFSHESQPYLISLFPYEPKREIKKLEMPVLIIHGSQDLEISQIDAHKLKACAPEATLVIIEGMNHVLKNVPVDCELQIDLYRDSTLPITRVLVTNILGFIGKVLRHSATAKPVLAKTV